MKFAKYKDFDAFFEALLPSEQAICAILRQLILDHFPELQEKFSYGAPFYHLNSRVCFLYPASLPYSGIETGVNFGLNRGHLLSNEDGMLEFADRKEVAYIHLEKPGDIQTNRILEILHEAILLDEAMATNKKR